LGFDSKARQLVVVPEIQEETRFIVPAQRVNYPNYEPYEFDTEDEIKSYSDTAKDASISDLYKEAYEIAKMYNDQSEYVRKLLAIETVTSYFQDKLPSVHYTTPIGRNGTSKTAFMLTFRQGGHRPAFLNSPNTANVYRLLLDL
jgi:hypothetical protein